MEKATILLVDDNPRNLQILIDYLQKSEYKTLVAQSGEKAIEQIRVVQPDLVLLDVIMPGIDGFETCRRLKADKATRHIPIIFMTVLANKVDTIKGFEAGGVDYISKPFHYREVHARVQTHLAIHKLSHKLQSSVPLENERGAEEQANVLVVDDNPLTLQVMLDYLSKLGFKVLVAQSGEKALRQIAHAKPDLILLDVLMPGIDGFETCRRLKSNITTNKIPILFMTALSNTSDILKGFEAGAEDYITKPLNYSEVVARVTTHLKLKKLRQLASQQYLL